MESSKNMLNEINQWACSAGRLTGHWPYILIQNKQEFRWKSIGVATSCFLLISSNFCGIYLNVNKAASFQNDSKIGSTQQLGHKLTAIIQLLSIVLLVLGSFQNRHEVGNLWNKIGSISEKVLDPLPSLSASIWAAERNVAGTEITKPNADDSQFQSQCREWISKTTLLLNRLVGLFVITVLAQSLLFSSTIFLHAGATHSLVSAVPHTLSIFVWNLCIHVYWIIPIIYIGIIYTLGLCFKILSLRIKWISRSNTCNGNGNSILIVNTTERISEDALDEAVRSCIKLSDGLRAWVEEANLKFSIQSLLVFLNLILSMVFATFFAIVNFGNDGHGPAELSGLVATLMDIVILYLLCSCSTEFAFQAENFGATLGQLMSLNLPNETISVIQLKSLKLTLKPPEISPGNYFALNNKLITSLLAVLSTYLVILIQFDGGSKTDQ